MKIAIHKGSLNETKKRLDVPETLELTSNKNRDFWMSYSNGEWMPFAILSDKNEKKLLQKLLVFS